MDISPQEQKWIVDHLGHTLDVHNIHYKAVSDVIERVDIAKLLLILDNGLMAKYKGCRIQDIELSGKI